MGSRITSAILGRSTATSSTDDPEDAPALPASLSESPSSLTAEAEASASLPSPSQSSSPSLLLPPLELAPLLLLSSSIASSGGPASSSSSPRALLLSSLAFSFCIRLNMTGGAARWWWTRADRRPASGRCKSAPSVSSGCFLARKDYVVNSETTIIRTCVPRSTATHADQA